MNNKVTVAELTDVGGECFVSASTQILTEPVFSATSTLDQITLPYRPLLPLVRKDFQAS